MATKRSMLVNAAQPHMGKDQCRCGSGWPAIQTIVSETSIQSNRRRTAMRAAHNVIAQSAKCARQYGRLIRRDVIEELLKISAQDGTMHGVEIELTMRTATLPPLIMKRN